MKKRKVRALVEDVIAYYESRVRDAPITFDNLTVDFETKTVHIHGRTIKVEHRAITFPLLSTDRLIVPKDGGQVL